MSKTLAAIVPTNVVVIPQRFTGREPVVIRRDRLISLVDGSPTVTLKIAGGHEVVLTLEEEASLDELSALLFGADALRFRALATFLGGPEKFAPSAVIGLDRSDRGRGALTLYLTNGRKFVRPFGVDVDSYRRLTDLLFGSDVAQGIQPWVQPGPSARVLAEKKRLEEWNRRLQKARAEDEAAAVERRAELERSRKAQSQYRTLGPDAA